MIICFTQDENVKNSISNIGTDGHLVEIVEYAKLLGVNLSNDLNWNRHVECIVKKKKAAKRVYNYYAESVKESRHSSIRSGHRVHKCCRPVIEYACPMWHTNLHLSDSIELKGIGTSQTSKYVFGVLNNRGA